MHKHVIPVFLFDKPFDKSYTFEISMRGRDCRWQLFKIAGVSRSSGRHNDLYHPDIRHRRSIRLNENDYCRAGAYFVTICTRNRECLFGDITDGAMRVQNFNFEDGILTVHGKGDKDRTVPLPQMFIPRLKTQLEAVSKLHDKDLAVDYDGVFLVDALEKKYPAAARDFIWQWFFPQKEPLYRTQTSAGDIICMNRSFRKL